MFLGAFLANLCSIRFTMTALNPLALAILKIRRCFFPGQVRDHGPRRIPLEKNRLTLERR